MDTLHILANPEPDTNTNQELVETVSFESEESGISNNELSDTPPENNSDYQESITTTNNFLKLSTSDSLSAQQPRFELPTPPTRPSHFHCDPAWHWDNTISPINSDCEEREFLEDSEKGAISQPSNIKKAKKKRKRKSHASREKRAERRQDYKKAKTAEVVKEASQLEVAEGANLHALRRRSRGRQPPSFLQLSLQNVYDFYRTFTLDEVQHGLIIRD